MPAELVRYDGHAPSFATTVSEFAVVIHPLFGLSGLVAKVMALRLAEAARRDIGRAMSEATRMMRGRSRFAEIAALTVPMLSQAMTVVVTRQQDGTTAVLDALSGPGPRALPGRRGPAGRSRRA